MDAKHITCAAKCCGNKLLGNSDLTFFTFPENAKLAQIWASNSNITYYHYGSTLCAEHFEDKYFNDKFSKKSVFKSDVEPIPTIFNIKENFKENIALIDSSINEIIDLGSDHEDNVLSAEKNYGNFLLHSDIIVDSHDYCRLCAQLLPSNILSPIYGSSNYDILIEMCLPGKCLETDELSHVICSSCVTKLESCCSILKSFLEADKELRNVQIKGNSIITEPSVSHQSTVFLKLADEVQQIIGENEIKNKKKELVRFRCIMCASGFNKKEDIITHAFHAHPASRGNKIISNIILTKSDVKKKREIKPKLNIQNTTNTFQCNVCKVEKSTKEKLIHHTETFHKLLSRKFVVKYMCVSCPTMYDNSKDVLDHALLAHPLNKIISKTVVIRNDSMLKDNTKIDDTLSLNKNSPIITNIRNRFENIVKSKENFESQNKIDPEINNIVQNPGQKRMYRRRAEREISEPTRSYQIKYQCRACFLLFRSYKEVLDHAELLHSSLFKSSDNKPYTDTVVLLVKINSGELSFINEELGFVPDSVIPINDGTIIEIEPNIKPEKSTNLKTITNFKCLKCCKMFSSKNQLIEHALLKHPTPGVNQILCKEVTIKKDLNNIKYRKEWYECLICSSHHMTKYSISRHTRFIHPLIGKDKFLCRFIDPKNRNSKECLHCNMVLNNCRHYRIHMKRHISFPCNECESRHKNINDLRKHLKQHRPQESDFESADSTHKCVVCNEEFTEKEQLRKHATIHKIPIDITCLKCNKTLCSEYDLYRHSKGHETCLCYICGKTYEKGYIRNHIQTHNTDYSYKCKICSRAFKTCYAVSKHKMTHHHSGDIYTMCQVCGKKIQRRSLNLHMRIHTNKKREICDVCGKAFVRRDHLRLHLKTHMNHLDRLYPCSICNIEFFARKSLVSHMCLDHGIESNIKAEKKCFICKICDKRYSTKVYLQDHYRQHRGEKNYSCDVCNKSFGTRITLLQHKLTHLDYEEFPYKCEVCNKKFKRRENCRNHKRIHTGEKPFPCPSCERPFRVRGEMIKHMRTHIPMEKRELKKQRFKSSDNVAL